MSHHPFLKTLTGREFDILQYHGVDTYPRVPRKLIEVSQSAMIEHVGAICSNFK